MARSSLRSPIPLARVHLAPAAARAFSDDTDSQVEALRRSASILPGESWAVVRADGGLWVVTGHEALWVIFGVAAGDWKPAGGKSPR